MDDTILLDNDYNRLQFRLHYINSWLNQRNLYLSPNKTVITIAVDGVKFLKVNFYPKTTGYVHMVPNRKSCRKEKQKLIKMKELFIEGKIETVEDIHSSFMSWRGYTKTTVDFLNILM